MMDDDEAIRELEKIAARLDAYLSHPDIMKLHPHYVSLFPSLKRNSDSPPFVEMPADWQEKSRAYYRTPGELMRDGPASFMGLSGQVYTKTTDGYEPRLPETGLMGPGRMGVGHDTVTGRPIPESRVIDLVPFLTDENGTLRISGGMRGDTGQPCFVGGFVERGAFESLIREFVEEAVSGSFHVPAEQLAAYHGDEGEKKYHFLAEHDKPTLEKLAAYFKDNLSIGYKGPVLADPNRTDDRWVATSAFTGFIKLEELRGILQKSPYKLDMVAGSDLKETKLHAFGRDFLINGFASHGPIACYSLAHHIREHGMARLPESAVVQIADALKTTTAFLDAHPLPARRNESFRAAKSLPAPEVAG